MVTLQEYLNSKYPTQADKESVTEIIIDGILDTLPQEETEQLDGSGLNLTSYPNLKTVWIDGNCLATKLTSLDLSNCLQLTSLYVGNHHLTTLNLSNCDQLQDKLDNNFLTLHLQTKLKWSLIDDNNFSESDLAFLQWIKQGFSGQEAIELSKLGCKLSTAEQWSKAGFTPQQTQQWLKVGLTSAESYLATWIRDSKHLTIEQVNNDILLQIKKEYNNSTVLAVEWLEQHYPNQRTEIIYINQLLKGVLDCSKYKSLKRIFISSLVDSNRFEIIKGSYEEYERKYETELVSCRQAQTYLEKELLTPAQKTEIKRLKIFEQGLEGHLNLSSVSKQLLGCFDNYLTQITYPVKSEVITILDISDNNLTDSDCTVFSGMENLEKLYIGNTNRDKIQAGIYNHWSGSLAPLQGLTKLKLLDISNTDLDSGWEYLPESLEDFHCSANLRLEAQCQTLFKCFANETSDRSWITNFPQKLQELKNWNKLGFTESEIKTWTSLGIKLHEYNLAHYLKTEQKLTPDQLKDLDLERLRAEYREYQDPTWQYIHPDFTEELQSEWKNKGFTGTQTEEWIKETKLTPTESYFVKYCQDKNLLPVQVSQQLAKLLREYNDQLELQIQEYQKKESLFTDQQENIRYLELRVQELTNLIKKQKEKIINTFLRLFSERELLQSLITVHLEFKRAEKQELPSREYRRKFNKLYEELAKKLTEETMNEIDIILKDCEELVIWELELENKLQTKSLKIENQKQTLLQITAQGEEARISELKVQLAQQETINQQQQMELEQARQQSLEKQIELLKIKDWQQKHLQDIKQKNAFITELEEQVEISPKK